jgi:signal transduction histidine kinase
VKRVGGDLYDQDMTAVPPPSAGGWAAPAVPAAPASSPTGFRRTRRLSGSIAIAVLCAFAVLASAGYLENAGNSFPPAITAFAAIGAFPMLALSVLLVWRHRFPVIIPVVATALSLLLPTSPLPALIGLAALTAVRRGWLRWTMMAGTFAATAVSLCWDIAAHSSYLSDFVGKPAEGTPERLALLWAVPLVAALAVAPFTAYGMSRFLRRERDAARLGSAAAERTVAALHHEVSLERERQELAREIHDTLASRLSVLSLHAGALELTVGDTDEKATAAARAVRESAQNSLDDLRHVVKVLRNPGSETTAAATGLGDLGTLIDEALHDGTDVRAQVLVGDPSSCDPLVAHACYRLAQEAISNVRRHAPGAALRLEVRGGPWTGLTITAVNWLAPGNARPGSTGTGHGLQGMSERAALVGGTFQAGPTPEGSFAVVAWLPWTPR